MKYKFQTEVILARAELTGSLFLEKVALLDTNVSLNEDGSLPSEKYCVYIRAAMDCHNFGKQYITDWTTCNSTENLDRLKWVEVNE